jgi:hypothetical protein
MFVTMVRGSLDVRFSAEWIFRIQVARFGRFKFVGGVAKQFFGVKIYEDAAVIGGRRKVKGLVTNRGDGWAEFTTDESVIDTF